MKHLQRTYAVSSSHFRVLTHVKAVVSLVPAYHPCTWEAEVGSLEQVG